MNVTSITFDNNPVIRPELEKGYDVTQLLQGMQILSGQIIRPDTPDS